MIHATVDDDAIKPFQKTSARVARWGGERPGGGPHDDGGVLYEAQERLS